MWKAAGMLVMFDRLLAGIVAMMAGTETQRPLTLKFNILFFFFFFFFFRFLYRRSSALMCWSSTDVLFWTDWGTFCAGGHPNVHFS